MGEITIIDEICTSREHCDRGCYTTIHPLNSGQSSFVMCLVYVYPTHRIMTNAIGQNRSTLNDGLSHKVSIKKGDVLARTLQKLYVVTWPLSNIQTPL